MKIIIYLFLKATLCFVVLSFLVCWYANLTNITSRLSYIMNFTNITNFDYHKYCDFFFFCIIKMVLTCHSIYGLTTKNTRKKLSARIRQQPYLASCWNPIPIENVKKTRLIKIRFLINACLKLKWMCIATIHSILGKEWFSDLFSNMLSL